MAALHPQNLIFTVLPAGQTTRDGEVFLDFSVVVTPRLMSGSSDTEQLGVYLDWASPSSGVGRTWPETVAAFQSSLKLVVGTPVSDKYPAQLLLTHLSDGTPVPNPGFFADLFGKDTDVVPFVFQGMDNRLIRSAPVGTVVDKLHDLYGRFGFTSGEDYPEYKDLVGVDSFGPMGFQQHNDNDIRGAAGIPGDGTARKATLVQALEAKLAAAKAIPYDLSHLAASTGIEGAAASMAFLQHQRFFQRGLPAVQQTLTTSPPVPNWDFHQVVAALGSLPAVQRLMGFVLELQAGPIDTSKFPHWTSTTTADEVLVNISLDTSVFLTPFDQPPVLARTKAIVHKGVFRPAPKSPGNTDHVLRMLKLGEAELFPVIRVDHDSAAIKTIQFANNVTRSREQDEKLTLTTPDRYALPALRTGGFAVARSGRAVQMAATLQRQTDDLQDGYYGNAGTPTLYEDDLIRGYRFDVLDVTKNPKTGDVEDGIWRSLMWRQGTVTINGTALPTITEEDTVVPAPTTATRTDPPDPNADLYLQETLTRWDGWSLGVPRPGTSADTGGPPPAPASDSPFPMTTDWKVPGSYVGDAVETATDNHHRLPRLRFGRTYRLRARTADLAGNAWAVDKAPHGSAVVSPPLTHLRFEPIPAPRLLLVQKEDLRPGGTEEVVVVRSESATVDDASELDNKASTRIVVPAPTSVFTAEQHGAWDNPKITGDPMIKLAALHDFIAQRDAANVMDDAVLARATSDPSLGFGTANPLLYPPFLPIKYLPEVLGEEALVRDLPINALKKTTAVLPFDVLKSGWPALQAARIVLSRGPTGWTVNKQATDPNDADNVTSELDLKLAKGVTVHCLVNAGINAHALKLMAVWEWIQDYAKKHNKPTGDLETRILAGEHWMFTPWRRVTFVHAVRTPLKKPALLFEPDKQLGNTYATFTGTRDAPRAGTVLFSRKSTARVDVDATWSMPIDTGSNADPVTPQHFQGHVFSLDLARTGGGWAPTNGGPTEFTDDAENLHAMHHEFGDTKFRSVTYAGTATSEYPEFFRESLFPDLGADPLKVLHDNPYAPGVPFEGSTVQLTLSWQDGDTTRTRRLVPAPAGTAWDTPAPTPGDYVVVEDPTLNSNPSGATNGTIQVLEFADVYVNRTAAQQADTAQIEFSYVGPTIHTFSNPAADKSANLHVLNSARPRAPQVRYVIPIYKRTSTSTSVSRTGGGLRVYLERPWWSTGDQERLGVVCWHPRSGDNGTLPNETSAPYVTQWGFDPVFQSANVPAQPSPKCFPRATKSRTDGRLTLEESSALVDVAGHDVGFDSDRNLWYCDIQVTDDAGHALSSYMPFIRLALARYQPYSVDNAHLSKVVLADYAQLAPNRHVTVTGSGATSRTVTVAGRAPIGTHNNPNLESRMVLIVEEEDIRITDDAIAWSPASGPRGYKSRIAMEATHSGKSDDVTWRASVLLPKGNTKPLRFTFEEYERINKTGDGRLAWTESIPISHVVSG